VLSISDASIVQGGGLGFFAGQQLGEGAGIGKHDEFRTSNEFYGAQFGARAELRLGCGFYLLHKTLIAAGPVVQEVDIDGFSQLWLSDQLSAALPGGLLAQSSNIGSHSQTEFCVVPEVSLTLGWQVFKCMRLFVGYSGVYMSDVARPGNQVDRVVNLGLVPTSPSFGTPGPEQPRVLFKTTEFWAHGMHFGFALRY
jgi:hypothetical protein